MATAYAFGKKHVDWCFIQHQVLLIFDFLNQKSTLVLRLLSPSSYNSPNIYFYFWSDYYMDFVTDFHVQVELY
jgi:hypothetical protein